MATGTPVPISFPLPEFIFHFSDFQLAALHFAIFPIGPKVKILNSVTRLATNDLTLPAEL
jgi:hypothetical protein